MRNANSPQGPYRRGWMGLWVRLLCPDRFCVDCGRFECSLVPPNAAPHLVVYPSHRVRFLVRSAYVAVFVSLSLPRISDRPGRLAGPDYDGAVRSGRLARVRSTPGAAPDFTQHGSRSALCGDRCAADPEEAGNRDHGPVWSGRSVRPLRSTASRIRPPGGPDADAPHWHRAALQRTQLGTSQLVSHTARIRSGLRGIFSFDPQAGGWWLASSLAVSGDLLGLCGFLPLQVTGVPGQLLGHPKIH